MASATISVSQWYAPSSSLGAYPESSWLQHQLPPSGTPKGSATATATVAADGSVAFTGLAADTRYFATDASGTRYVRFSTFDDVPPAQQTRGSDISVPPGGTAQQVLAKNSSTDGDASWVTPEPSGPRVVTVADLGASYALDLVGDARVLLDGTMTQNCTLTVTNPAAGSEGTIEVDGNFTLALPGGDTVTPGAGVSTIAFYSPDGVTVRCFEVGAGATATVDYGTSGILQPEFRTIAPMNAVAGSPAANSFRGLRYVAQKSGVLKNVIVGVSVAAGNLLAAVYDTGEASAGNRTLLWEGVATTAATGWLNLGDPDIAVAAGQHLDICVCASDATVAYQPRWVAPNASHASALPTGYLPDAVAAPKLAWTYAAAGVDAPATIAEASIVAANNTTIPLILARIE